MGLIGTLARAWLVDRMLRGNRRRGGYPGVGYPGHGYPARGYGRHGHRARSPYGPGPRGRVGFTGPFPTYSRRTRRGGRVSVGGCCLPIPLAVLASTTLGAAGLVRRRGRARG